MVYSQTQVPNYLRRLTLTTPKLTTLAHNTAHCSFLQREETPDYQEKNSCGMVEKNTINKLKSHI